MSTTPLGARPRLWLTSMLLLSATLLVACGGPDGTAGPAPGPASSPAPSDSGPSDDARPSATDAASPATGELVETKAFSVNVPERWGVDVVSEDFVITAGDPGSSDTIAFSIVDTYGKELSLEELAQQAVRLGSWPAEEPSIVAETELGGEPAYHLTGSGGGVHVDSRGALHDGSAVSVRFEGHRSGAALRSILESVLATWQWK